MTGLGVAGAGLGISEATGLTNFFGDEKKADEVAEEVYNPTSLKDVNAKINMQVRKEQGKTGGLGTTGSSGSAGKVSINQGSSGSVTGSKNTVNVSTGSSGGGKGGSAGSRVSMPGGKSSANTRISTSGGSGSSGSSSAMNVSPTTTKNIINPKGSTQIQTPGVNVSPRKTDDSPADVRNFSGGAAGSSGKDANYVYPVFNKNDKFYAAKSDGILAQMFDEVIEVVKQIVNKKNEASDIYIDEYKWGEATERGVRAYRRK